MLQLDKIYGNNLWADAIAEEMAKVQVAFQLYKGFLQKLAWY